MLKAEAEAERGRAELAAHLEKMAPHDRRACAAAESACAMEALRLQLSDQEVNCWFSRAAVCDVFDGWYVVSWRGLG